MYIIVMDIDILLDTLDQAGEKEGLSRLKLARRLDVNPSYLYMLRNGTRQPGLTFLITVISEFPELKNTVLTYIKTLARHR